jgi:hypothetical protein
LETIHLPHVFEKSIIMSKEVKSKVDVVFGTMTIGEAGKL